MSVSSSALSHFELHSAKPLAITVATARKLSGLGNTTIWALIKAASSNQFASTVVASSSMALWKSCCRPRRLFRHSLVAAAGPASYRSRGNRHVRGRRGRGADHRGCRQGA
jgi:hypothetical protein